MNYSSTLLDNAAGDIRLNGFTVRAGGTGMKMPFPLDKTYISLECYEENISMLIGDDALCSEEKIKASVLSPMRYGASYCRQVAETLCLVISDADINKRLISVSVGKCSPVEIFDGYRIEIIFGMRAVRKYGGDPDAGGE